MGEGLRVVGRYAVLFWHLGRIGLRVAAEYRANLVLGLLSTLILNASGILLVAVVLDHFHSLMGWTVPAIALLLGLRSLSHGLFVMFLNPLRSTASVIRRGDLDRLLLRPVHVLFQLGYGGQVELRGLGDLGAGVGYMVYASVGLHLRWTVPWLLWLVLVTLSGTAIEASFYLITSISAFWTMQDRAMRATTWILHENMILYPISIYGKLMRYVLTFVVPFAFINYYPAVTFLAAGRMPLPPGASTLVGYLAPAVAISSLALAGMMWGWASRRYVSTGS